ncbi:MAG: HTTM domain-containing protein [Bacteroidota bacterium]
MRRHLTSPLSIAPLVSFRIAFGALMLFSTLRFMYMGWVENHFVDPMMHFTYFGFNWVKPLPAVGMYVVHVLMILGSLGIMLGFRYRVAALVYFLCFTYCELIDLTYYLNHYYFVSIVSLIMVFLPANRGLSLDVWLNPSLERKQVPAWVIRLLQLQLAIVYVYAGLAKINHAWLMEAMPLRIWLPAHDHLPLIGWAMRYKATAFLFSWFGMLYDTFIVFFLLWKPTRALAYVAVIVFHVMTGILFQIGVFPLVMIALTPIFFSPQWHEKVQGKVRAWLRLSQNTSIEIWQPYQPRVWGMILGTYLVFQLLFPWRYLLYDGNLFWNEEGYRFSWRVMLMEKAGTALFYVKDTKTGREGVVDNSEFLNPHQEKQMAMQPDMILQYAHFLAEHYAEKGVYEPEVRAEVYVTLNGRPSRLYIDPKVNLVEIQDGWKQKDWVLPYKDPKNKLTQK